MRSVPEPPAAKAEYGERTRRKGPKVVHHEARLADNQAKARPARRKADQEPPRLEPKAIPPNRQTNAGQQAHDK